MTQTRRGTRTRTAVAALLGAAMIASVPPPGGAGVIVEGEVLGADHLVVVGADDPASQPPPSVQDRFEYLAYYPARLQVHRGDVVRFRWDGDHSVTFYEDGEREDSLLVRDELPGEARLDGVFASRDDCALGDAVDDLPPCVLSSEAPALNAGASSPSDTFGARVQIDLPEGVYAYFCVFHATMRGEVEVVDDDEEVATPQAVEDARRVQVAADTAAAEAILSNHRTPPPEVVDDHRRWQVQVGGSTPDGRVALLGYLPANLTVAPGDEVEFVAPSATGIEGHSASFLPLPDPIRDNAPLHYIDLRCDADGTDEGGPGVPGLPAVILTGGCPNGDIELVWHPWAYRAPVRSPGNVVAGVAPTHDSGLLLPPMEECRDTCDPWTGEPMPTTFDAVFPQTGSFEYWCFIHDPRGMSGGITVAAP